MNTKLSEYFIGCLFHDFCTWVEVFVNPVPEAHQTEGVVLVLGFCNKLVDTGYVADLVEHLNDSFVSTTVRGSPECRNTCCDTRKWVGLRRACQTYSRRGRVLLMVCVEQEDTVHRAGDGWRDNGWLAGVAKHHMQEVRRVIQVVARVHEWLTDGELVTHCCDSRHFRNQTKRCDFAVIGIRYISGVVIKRRQSTNNATHNRHWVSVATEAVKEGSDLLVHHGVVRHHIDERFFLF